MRRIAIFFGVFVALTVGVLNYIDAKYPNALNRIQSDGAVPSPTSAAGEQTNPSPTQQAAAPTTPTASTKRVPLEDQEEPGIYPGARIDRIMYGSRPYDDMTVLSISAQTVVLRNDREIVSIPTGSLPDEYRRMAIAYLNGSESPTLARSGSAAFPTSEKPPSAPQAQSAAVAPAVGAPAQDAAQEMETLVWQAARDRAERWLHYERARRATDIVPLVTGVDLKTPLPMTGLPGYWKVRGRGYVATYQAEKGGTFHDFEVTVVLDKQGNVLRADIEIL